jgi:hypothetical protein
MRTVTTPPVCATRASFNDRSLAIEVHREPTRRLPWIASVTYESRWPGEGALGWEVHTGTPAVLIRTLSLFDLRQLLAGIRAGEGEAPPAMEARREQVRQVWLGLVNEVSRGVGREL